MTMMDSYMHKKFYRITVNWLWWQNEKGLTDWAYRTSTRERVPLPFYRKGGREGFAQDLYSGRI